VTDAACLSSVVVVACDSESDHVAPLVPLDIRFVPYLGRDALGTYAAVLRSEAFGPHDPRAGGSPPCRRAVPGVVRICADTPFVDPVLIDRLIRTADDHPECDYIGYVLRSGRPAIFSPVGIFAEWCRAEAVMAADRDARDALDRQHPTRFVYSRPERFCVRLIEAPPELDRADLRLTIASEEDWEHTQAIYDAVGPDGMDWQRVADLLDHHPRLRERMAVLNRAGTAAAG